MRVSIWEENAILRMNPAQTWRSRSPAAATGSRHRKQWIPVARGGLIHLSCSCSCSSCSSSCCCFSSSPTAAAAPTVHRPWPAGEPTAAAEVTTFRGEAPLPGRRGLAGRALLGGARPCGSGTRVSGSAGGPLPYSIAKAPPGALTDAAGRPRPPGRRAVASRRERARRTRRPPPFCLHVGRGYGHLRDLRSGRRECARSERRVHTGRGRRKAWPRAARAPPRPSAAGPSPVAQSRPSVAPPWWPAGPPPAAGGTGRRPAAAGTGRCASARTRGLTACGGRGKGDQRGRRGGHGCRAASAARCGWRAGAATDHCGIGLIVAICTINSMLLGVGQAG